MEKLFSVYAEFEKMVVEDRIYEDDTVDFASICGALGVSPEELDKLLVEELGYTGEEYLAELRRDCVL